MDKPVPPVVSIERFCEDFACSRSTVYNLIRAGKLNVVKNGRRTLITREEYYRQVDRLATLSLNP